MNTLKISRTVGLGVVAALVTTALPFASASAAPTPAKPSLTATSHDGAAFDLDEYADGDITVQVIGADKQPVDVEDQVLSYSWDAKPFALNTSSAAGSGVQEIESDGRFVVPLPTHGISGTYVLTAGLGPDASAANAISSAVRLTVKTGNAKVTLGDANPLQAVVGANRSLAGALRLADGTALPGRLMAVGISRGAEGTDPEADAGFLAAPADTTVLDAVQVTTAANGTFSTTLTDPAEDGQGTELGGTVTAEASTTPDIGNADTDTSIDVDFVSTTAPAGSTAVLTDLGGGTPGQSLAGKLTVMAPDDTFEVDPGSDPDPVEGQVYTLSIDHGFFTTGQGTLPSVVGAPAGDLVQLGTKLTGITNADGEVEFQVGIARDKGFDDNGLVTATVKATAGGLVESKSAAWDSTNPLNSQVAVTLSPASEQEAPVNPAVAGDHTYYDIFTLDQFGNRVGGKDVDLAYSGDLDDWDYSDTDMVSDFDTFGDIWVTSFEAGAIDIAGTWENAPTYRYVDTAGTADAGTADAIGSTTASFYEVSFTASKFSIRSTATDVVKVGTPATQTVRVIDQKGRPVRGYDVQFFRVGPDTVRGDALATRTTNARGEASYTFVGNRLGRGTVTAEISDGTRSRILRHTVVFGSTVKARLVKGKGGSGADQLTVSTKPLAAGAKVQLYRVVKGKKYSVGIKKLSRAGKVTFKIRDRNRNKSTRYVALVRSTSKTVADQSNAVKLR